MANTGLTVWQQLEVSGGDGFSFESALLSVIKQCEYELAQSSDTECASNAIRSYLEALKAARLRYKAEKQKFVNSLIDEWNTVGGDYSVIAEALRTGHYDILVV